MSETVFEAGRVQGGCWIGHVRSDDPAFGKAEIALVLAGEEVAPVRVAPAEEPGLWRLEAEIPAGLIEEGVQTFTIERAGDVAPLASFSILAGVPLAADIRAELDLLRAELELVKRVLRRHLRESRRDGPERG